MRTGINKLHLALGSYTIGLLSKQSDLANHHLVE